MTFPEIYCKIRQKLHIFKIGNRSHVIYLYGERSSGKIEPKFHLNAHNFKKVTQIR